MSRSVFVGHGASGCTLITPSKMIRLTMSKIDSPEKWAKGDYYMGAGSCVLGALVSVSDGDRMSITSDNFSILMDALRDSFRSNFPDINMSEISDINDDPSVTWEDIMQTLEKTALKLEEMGN